MKRNVLKDEARRVLTDIENETDAAQREDLIDAYRAYSQNHPEIYYECLGAYLTYTRNRMNGVKFRIDNLSAQRRKLDEMENICRELILGKLITDGEANVRTKDGLFSVRKGEPDIIISDPEALRYRFRIYPDWQVNRKELRKAYRNGETVEGVTFVPRKTLVCSND